MNSAFVLDCSVTMTWFFDHESAPATDAIQSRLAGEATAIVPLHWRLEVGNTLLVAERRRVKSQSKIEHFLELLAVLSIETDLLTDKRALNKVLSVARQNKLTSYDAAYLDLALSRGIPLATLDKELRAAARKLGVELLPESL